MIGSWITDRLHEEKEEGWGYSFNRSSKNVGIWYYITEIYCPICSYTKVYRERKYGIKPERYEDRHEVVETYDGCQE